MGQTLYRKNRPKHWQEVVGQSHITQTLTHAIEQNAISHAYLFTGPHGVGKTSVARILAHAVNKLDYTDETTHLDIIEIDAASNRRIDEIRELRERVHIAPTSATYKVYIIDEVHMLTTEAFNALLKTLEEPPKHVIFILATTEAHKLPETIISRTQRFNFKPIEKDFAVKHLKNIAKHEKVDISPEALSLIADYGNGSFRDSISLLDQARSLGKRIELNDLQNLLGIAPSQVITNLLTALASRSPSAVINELLACKDQGYNPARLSRQLAAVLRSELVTMQTTLPEAELIHLLRDLLEIPASHDPETALELALLDFVLQSPASMNSATKLSHSEPSSVSTPKQSPPKKDVFVKLTDKKSKPTPAEVNQNLAADELWQRALESIKDKHNTLYGLARMADAAFDGQTLTLCFQFPFHQKRLNEAKNKIILQDVLQTITGRAIEIVCVVDKTNTTPKEPTTNPTKANPAIDTISNIFGGAEVLE